MRAGSWGALAELAPASVWLVDRHGESLDTFGRGQLCAIRMPLSTPSSKRKAERLGRIEKTVGRYGEA